MNIKSISGVFYVFIFSIGITPSVNAAPVTNYFAGTIDWITADVYGTGSTTVPIGSLFDFTITYDSDSAMATVSPDSSGFGTDYDFYGPPYGGIVTMNGITDSSSHSALNVGNDAVLPPGFTLDPVYVDAGVPSDLSSYTLDQLWMGLHSDDVVYGGDGIYSGFEVAMIFIDLGGSIFDSESIPGSAPSLETIDFAFFDFEQWVEGVLVFEAGGMLANNFVPEVPVPSALWLFGSGLIGLIGIARRKSCA